MATQADHEEEEVELAREGAHDQQEHRRDDRRADGRDHEYDELVERVAVDPPARIERRAERAMLRGAFHCADHATRATLPSTGL